jgi:hypothetical protein
MERIWANRSKHMSIKKEEEKRTYILSRRSLQRLSVPMQRLAKLPRLKK